MGLHAHVEPHQEVVEVEPYAHTVGQGDLLQKLIEPEHASLLVGILLDGPYIAGVDKDCALDEPEQLAAQLHIGHQVDIAALVDEAVHRVARGEAAGSQSAHAPAAHIVGTAGIEAFLKRGYGRVAIGHKQAAAHMPGQLVARVQVVGERVVGLCFHILCIAGAQHLVGLVLVVPLARNFGDGIEQVASHLGRGAHRVDILLLARGQGGELALVGVIEAVAHAHDQVVLVGVSQQGVGDAVKKSALALGQIHIAQVDNVEGVAREVLLLTPYIFPAGAGNHARVLGTCLVVEVGGEVGAGLHALLEALLEERGHKLGEGDAQLGQILRVVVVDEAVDVARYALVAGLELGIEHLGAVEDVAVLIVGPHAEAQVALRVGALERE